MPLTVEVDCKQHELTETRPRVVIACRVIKNELDALLNENDPVEVHYLDQNLHRNPEKMTGTIQAKVDEVSRYAGHIVLGYGLCSNGVVGVRAVSQEICVPRVHDCITLMLGSRQAFHEAFNAQSGTYYLSAGWLQRKKDPLGILEDEYIPRMGREEAVLGLREELQHYTRIVFIRGKDESVEDHRKRAMKNAAFLGMDYAEMEGSDRYFRKILFGPYDSSDFVCVPPGETIPQKPFLQG